MYRKKAIRAVLLLICLLSFCMLAFLNMQVQKSEETALDISGVTVKSEDRQIRIGWTPPAAKKLDAVQIRIQPADLSSPAREELYKPGFFHHAYLFTEGIPGTLYSVSVTARFADGSDGQSYEREAMFLDFDDLPDLPLLTVDTVNGEDPTYDDAEKPSHYYFGQTIENNAYLTASLRLSNSGTADHTLQARIRVRGNTSSVEHDKKSYKIVLSQPYPMAGGDLDSAQTEWLLLNAGACLNNYAGFHLAELCGVEWEPDMAYVNLMLNGDWKGCYLLTQPVSRETAGDLIAESGYLFEYDPYFWIADGRYFQTEYQDKRYGYTVKYPVLTDFDDPRITRLQDYLQEAEDYFVAGDGRYREYLDEPSFASWMLTKDILGELDGAGSNIYFYKYDFDPADPTSSKVKLGPIWDCDNSFQVPDDWATCHYTLVPYFSTLFDRESFSELYTALWIRTSATLCDDMEQAFSLLEETQGAALDKSWKLDGARWRAPVASLSEQTAALRIWFETRTQWINGELGLGE